MKIPILNILLFFSENFVFRILNFLIHSFIIFFHFNLFHFVTLSISLCFFFALLPFSICLRMYVFHFDSSKDESLRMILVSCHTNTQIYSMQKKWHLKWTNGRPINIWYVLLHSSLTFTLCKTPVDSREWNRQWTERIIIMNEE